MDLDRILNHYHDLFLWLLFGATIDAHRCLASDQGPSARRLTLCKLHLEISRGQPSTYQFGSTTTDKDLWNPCWKLNGTKIVYFKNTENVPTCCDTNHGGATARYHVLMECGMFTCRPQNWFAASWNVGECLKVWPRSLFVIFDDVSAPRCFIDSWGGSSSNQFYLGWFMLEQWIHSAETAPSHSPFPALAARFVGCGPPSPSEVVVFFCSGMGATMEFSND